MARNYNPVIAEAVKDYLTEDDWHFEFDEDDGQIDLGLSLKGRIRKIRMVISIHESDYNVIAISPLSADKDQPEEMQKMMEFICRANYGLRDGNFEFDCRDGEIRYKCYVPCNGSAPERKIIARSIHCPAAMFMRYGEGIVQILFNNLSAAEAVALCEEDMTPILDESSHESENDEEMKTRIMELLQRLRGEHGSGGDEESSEGSPAAAASGE